MFYRIISVSNDPTGQYQLLKDTILSFFGKRSVWRVKWRLRGGVKALRKQLLLDSTTSTIRHEELKLTLCGWHYRAKEDEGRILKALQDDTNTHKTTYIRKRWMWGEAGLFSFKT